MFPVSWLSAETIADPGCPTRKPSRNVAPPPLVSAPRTELWNPAHLGFGFVILFALFVPLEALFPIVRRQFWHRRGGWADIAHFFVTRGIRQILTLFVAVVLIQALGFQVYPPLQQSLLALPRWSQFLVAIFIFGLGTYWGYRCAHTVQFLWRFRAVHHSSEHLDWAVASRLHPVDQTFIRIGGVTPVYLLGFTKETFGFLIAIDGLLAIFIHANVRFRFGPFERLVATPAFHHWHHADEDAATTNKNYSGLRPCFDGFFGTLHLPPRYPVRYGIDESMPPTYLGQLIQPFRSRAFPTPPPRSRWPVLSLSSVSHHSPSLIPRASEISHSVSSPYRPTGHWDNFPGRVFTVLWPLPSRLKTDAHQRPSPSLFPRPRPSAASPPGTPCEFASLPLHARSPA